METHLNRLASRSLVLPALLFCCGCNQALLGPASPAKIGGSVHGGQQPIAGATIQLYAAGATGDGSAATSLASPVTTDTNGAFEIGSYTCPTPTTETYLLASAGNPGLTAGTNNTSIQLIAVLGECQSLGSFVSLNEVTTVAALAALTPYFTSPTSIGSGPSDASALNTAFSLATEYASTGAGSSPGSNVPSGYAVPTQEINTLANIIATCVNSRGGTAGDGSACGLLFTYATPTAGVAPTDTATALLDILNNPSSNISSLFNLPAPSAPFQPSLITAPSNWTVALTALTFTVTYAGNSATSGSVPVDNNSYQTGATVTVLGNTGILADTGLVFAGWNTSADGSGTPYTSAATFTMGSSNVTLYAQWRDWPISVWGGAQEAIALKSDGTVWTWGLNNWGELGNNTLNNSDVPVQVLGPGGVGYLTGIKSIMGGETHNVAVKSDGTVWAWGWNTMDQLGDGNTTESNVPVQVSNLTNIVSLGGRGYHTLALKSDGTVWAWGYDSNGALGNGIDDSNPDFPVPIQVPGITNAIQVTAGYNFSVALLADHTLMAWGRNKSGQLGNGTLTESTSPIAVPGISNVVWVSAGWTQVLAVKSDGTVWAWGANIWNGTDPGAGLLGIGSAESYSAVPVQVTGLTASAAMASGGDSLSAVLQTDGTVWTFGSNGAGQLGTGTSITQSLVPVEVEGLTNIIFITARDQHAQAIRSDGTIWSWGDGLEGELGNGQFSDSSVPVQVTPF